MEDLISRTFERWTAGKSPLAARINIFEKIRDIPYAVIPLAQDSEKGVEVMLLMNRGSCQPKHYLMADMFERLGIPVFYMIYHFMWDELEVDYPGNLKRLASSVPPSRHLACRAVIDGELVLVDATCDPALERIGVTVNKKWDGISSLSLPIVPLDEGEIYHSSERVYLEPPSFSPAETEFYMELNKWLDEVRNSPSPPAI